MSRDPQLARLRGTEVYRQEFGDDPRDDFFALAPVAPHAQLLRSLGYADPALVTAEPQSLDALPAAASAHVLGLARLHHSLVRRPPLAARAVEILHELSARGLTTPDSLRGAIEAERAHVCESAVACVTDRCKPRYEVGDGAQGTLTCDALLQWWNETYPAASPPPPPG